VEVELVTVEHTPMSNSSPLVMPPKMQVPSLPPDLSALLHPHGAVHSLPHSRERHAESSVSVDVGDVEVLDVVVGALQCPQESGQYSLASAWPTDVDAPVNVSDVAPGMHTVGSEAIQAVHVENS
jgi:hypothetical protein